MPREPTYLYLEPWTTRINEALENSRAALENVDSTKCVCKFCSLRIQIVKAICPGNTLMLYVWCLFEVVDVCPWIVFFVEAYREVKDLDIVNINDAWFRPLPGQGVGSSNPGHSPLTFRILNITCLAVKKTSLEPCMPKSSP